MGGTYYILRGRCVHCGAWVSRTKQGDGTYGIAQWMRPPDVPLDAKAPACIQRGSQQYHELPLVDLTDEVAVEEFLDG